MDRRFLFLGVTGLAAALACGHGENGGGSPGGTAGKAGQSAGTSGSSAGSDGGADDEGGQAGAGESSAGSGGAGGRGGSGGGGAGASGGAHAGAGSGGGGTAGRAPTDDGPQAQGDKVDLLIAVDNSISMAEKQLLFAKSIPELLERLVSPYCLDDQGDVVNHPATPSEACPSGSQREFAPLRDLHVGVITSSLGPHGASGATGDVCQLTSDDDHAHLLPSVRTGISSYDGRGFLKWDPDGVATPPGESDVQAFAASLESMIVGAGEHGCGYESQLESVYRFLVDPDPPQSVTRDDATLRSAKVGVDVDLLSQRQSFLRPDSSVAVLLLTDENDCSIIDESYGWLVAKGSSRMYRANSACLADPNDPCCQSCAAASTNAGCSPLATDSECIKGSMLTSTEDDLNLRCFEQKRRFGFDLLYPTARYVTGFGGGLVPNRAGDLVQNPLFHRGSIDRDPSLFTLVVVGGVPWQDLATPASLTSESLEYLTAAGLVDAKRWPVILGNSPNVPASDPFMLESMAPRSGENPIIHVPITPSSSLDPQGNPINGHEQQASNNDLQYACTFALPEPIVCDDAARNANKGCDCFAGDLGHNRPVCNPPGGGVAGLTQYYGKAYPALRPLAVAKELGRRAVLGSVCARNTQDEEAPDYGYRPVFGALGRRIADTLNK